ncbi:hypothetical protein N5K27_16365 [Pigmentiphaga sp. GD03639]|uniref:hypothetical protein n=1 Tax=Pigmentiphaga sp. GD03639 TaxID=2975354 RepID=UPI002447CAF2|nr:hypothetical protein [Pigmentiphaga sp. GD03639]MDH2237874.1 hypothetical protein [Pigmentiphaga sp. GD03639]
MPNHPYTLEQFCENTRATLRQDPGRAGQERVCADFERLLQSPAFVDKYCAPELERKLYRVHTDPELGFEVLVHLNKAARKSPPHDHGESWAIYGQVTRWVDITNYRRVDDGRQSGRADLTPTESFRLEPGQARLFPQGAIHAIDYPDQAVFARVTGRDLDAFHRDMFDLETGTVTRMTPQRAS